MRTRSKYIMGTVDRIETRLARGHESALTPAGVGTGEQRPSPLASGSRALSQRSVWYRLMKLTNLINRPFFTRFARRYHLSINDARVLVTLASMPDSAAHELCVASGMHPMNVSRSVATLRRQGRITERRDPDNRRRKILRLTAKGWTVSRSFVPDMEQMSDFLLTSMSAQEIEFLSRLVDQLITRLETLDGETGLPPPDPRSARRGRRA